MPLPVEKKEFNLVDNKRNLLELPPIVGESYITNEIVNWLLAEENEDDMFFSKDGLRYSPQAIRCLLNYMRIGYVYEEDGKKFKLKVPNEKWVMASAGVYGLINGFFSYEEYELFNKKGAIFRSHHPNKVEDLYQKSDKVFSSVKEMAEKVKKMKEDNPEVKSVLFHGKWNGVPHAGHILYMISSIGKILDEYGVEENKVVVMVACDSNRYIKEVSFPFLSTDWRMSLMSYLPIVDMVCCSGEFSVEQAGSVWEENYQILQPDFVPIEAKNELAKEQTRRAIKAGAEPLSVENFIYLDDEVDNRLSITGSLEGELDYENFKNTNQWLLNTIGLSWQRDWFKGGV